MMNCKTKQLTDLRRRTTTPYAGRGVVIRLVYLAVSMLCLPWTLWRNRQPQTIVLCYHGVRRDQAPGFRRQMVWLSRYLKRRRPRRAAGGFDSPVLVTFDDSFVNLTEWAVPVLEEVRIPCIVFAVADNLGQVPEWSLPVGHPDREETVMDAAQLALLAESPQVAIGSHTLSHPNLTTLSKAEARRELTGSREALERITNRPVEDLALPHGGFNAAVLGLAREAGYRRIFTLEEKPANLQKEEVAGRFLMSPDAWMIEFTLTCKWGYAWLYHLRKFIRYLKRVSAR
jgi:peptidoglycan/xylan/chitin deacetylase (PgdA/CDA1 family)